MKTPRVFSTYIYFLVGITIAGGFLAALGFAFISGLRHLLWLRKMSMNPLPHPWLWMGVVFIGVLIVSFWYRVITATLWNRQQKLLLTVHLMPLLRPFPQQVQSELEQIADWYLIADKERYAFTWGIRHPQIAISSGLWAALDESAQKAVMYHEAAHVLAHDPLQQALLQVLSYALRPLGMTGLYQRYLIRREIVADTIAVAACDGDDVPLLMALLAATESPLDFASRVGLAGALEARIQFIETRRLPPWWDHHLRYRLVSTLVAILLTLGEGLLVWCH